MSDVVKPLFHYSYKNEATILDSQYNYQGNMLAVCNSDGQIFFYHEDLDEQNRESLFSIDRKKIYEKKSAAVLKIAWSLPIFGLFASISISKEIDIHQCHKNRVESLICKRYEYIPLCVTFCPIESEVVLTVGFSDGSICFYDETLNQIHREEHAHEEAVNCLHWEHKILTYEKNKWIMNNFSHVKKFLSTEGMPFLLSGSSDCHLKIWKFQKKKLTELSKVKAHSKALRDVQWKPNYLADSDRMIITCSQDGYVKIWKIKSQSEKEIVLESRCEKNFGGAVYKASFNFSGSLIGVSYCNEAEERVETVAMRENNGVLMEEIKIPT